MDVPLERENAGDVKMYAKCRQGEASTPKACRTRISIKRETVYPREKWRPRPQACGIYTGQQRLLQAFNISHQLLIAVSTSADQPTNQEDLMAKTSTDGFTLESVRQSLIRQEDTIVFSLIERAKFPFNSPTYDQFNAGFSGSLLEYIVKETEILQAKVGRYTSPEENPFFPDELPLPIIPPRSYPQVLHPAAASININKSIWKMYLEGLLPLFTAKGDDGNYGSTAEADLQCLQALSRRIHYGKFVAEVKFIDAPQDYEPAIRAQDRDALMKLLTFESVEEMVKKRVGKKAMVFGQDVTLNAKADDGNYKVDPAVVSRLYDEWVMPLTKLVEVEYLLRRLD